MRHAAREAQVAILISVCRDVGVAAVPRNAPRRAVADLVRRLKASRRIDAATRATLVEAYAAYLGTFRGSAAVQPEAATPAVNSEVGEPADQAGANAPPHHRLCGSGTSPRRV